MQNEYSASITGEPLLFYEMRTVARLLAEGKTEQETVDEIVRDNLFQYPTERKLKRIAGVCLRRLAYRPELLKGIAESPSEDAKQMCLYLFMLDCKVLYDFMTRVIAEKYRTFDMHFGKMEVNVFMMRLMADNDNVAEWTESTINKVKQIIIRTLVETEYLDKKDATTLNPVYLCSALKEQIENKNELAAFNCLL